MVKSFFTFFILIFIFTFLNADFQQEKILFRQANNFNFRKQYSNANRIYEKILKLNPSNAKALEKYIQNLLKLKKISEAEQLLAKYKNNISEGYYKKLKVTILLFKGEYQKAEKMALDFLKNDNNYNSFIIYANLFGMYRQYETVEEIYLLGRKNLKDENAFSYYLAMNYKYNSEYKKALKEFINYLRIKKNIFFVKRNILDIVENDNSVVELLNRSEPKDIQVIYVIALFEIGKEQQALKKAKNLTVKQLEAVIDDREANNDFNNSVKLLELYYNRLLSESQKDETKIRMAKILLENNKIDKAKELLIQVYENSKKENKYKKANINVECRKLLAKITLMSGEDENIAIKYLKEAKKMSLNAKERNDLELQILYLSILKSNFKDAKKVLDIFTKKNKNYEKADYYYFLIYALQGDKQADSLLVDLIIKQPESELTNDALLLNFYLSLLDKNSKNLFVKAYQNKKLYRYEKAYDYLNKCYEKSQKEEFLYLAAQWYLEEGREIPNFILTKKYENKYIQVFFDYIKVIKDEDNFKNKAIEFLSKNPSSIFSSKLRRKINVDEQTD